MIEGRLTRLRHIETTDVALLTQWPSEPAVMRTCRAATSVASRHELEREIAGRLSVADSPLRLVIETLDGQSIGRLDVDRIDVRHRSAEIVLGIGDASAHVTGYISDALATACHYLFDQRALRRITLTVLANDAPAIAVVERLGFRPEGQLRGSRWVNGAPVDEVALSLLAGELRDGG